MKVKSTLALSGKVLFGNTDASTPPGAIIKVFTESGSRWGGGGVGLVVGIKDWRLAIRADIRVWI